MKKSLFFTLLSLMLLIVACRDDDFGDGATLQPVPFTVMVKFDQTVGGLNAKNTNVVLKNDATGEEVKGKTDENGELKLTQVFPGVYSIVADLSLTKEQYFDIFGMSTNREEINFNGSQEKVSINANISSTAITLSNGTVGDFVIKQHYYAGSDTKNGALLRDQFTEIHNNSNTTLYADGLYIALVHGKNNATVTQYTLPNGQWDWSQSAGNSLGSAANTDYVYATNIIKIPGSGKDYPVAPGKSIIIAQTAINHKAPYTNINGVNVPILDPSLTVDLSGADFEAYLGDYFISIGDKPFATDIQNPAVKDVGIVHWTSGSNDWILNLLHRPAIVIFNGVTDAEVKSWNKVPLPNAPTGSVYTRISKKVIMDGVDIGSKNDDNPKDLPSDIDAGKASIKNAAGENYADYTSFSVIRKTKSTINGRVILQDTNNSTNDFVTIKANPRGYAN